MGRVSLMSNPNIKTMADTPAEQEIQPEKSHEVGESADLISDAVVCRKLDYRLMPLICITYALQSIDKTTLGYAAVFGLREDLGLVGTEFSWASAIFYLGYLVWEYPTNILLQRFPVNTVLSVTVVIWGVVLMLHASVQGFASLAAARTFLGVFEASMNPASMILFTMYYKRQEQPLRFGIWIGCAGIGYICAGIVSFGIGHIHSAIASWRLMFLIWGAVTVVWGIFLWLTLPGSPTASKCWTEDEKARMLERIKDNGTGVEDRHFKVAQFKEAMLDLKTWLLFFFAVTLNCPNGGLTAFQGLIVKGMGFSILQTTLIQMPSGAVQLIGCVAVCFIVSRFQNARFAAMLICLAPFLAGIIGLWLIAENNPYGRLACLWIAFSYTASWSLSMSVATANTSGHTKKVTTNAIMLIGYCLGNFIGPFFFLTRQAPRYPLGVGMMLACVVLQICIISGVWLLLVLRNRGRQIAQTEEERRVAQDNGFSDVTDKLNPYFRYVY